MSNVSEVAFKQPPFADSLGLNRPAGVLINKLHPASPLLDEGMKVGDVVTAVNGRVIRDPGEMKFRLATIPIGEEVKIDVLRKGKPLSFSVKTIAPPDEPSRDERTLGGNSVLRGVGVANINPAVAVELNLKNEIDGVVVTDVSDSGRISRILRPGDIIVSVNNVAVTKVGVLEEVLKKAAAAGSYALVVDRDGVKTQLIIR